MRWQWLHKAGQGKLLVFCNGCGMDEQVVSHLRPDDFDILMLFDYVAPQLPPEVEQIITAASYRAVIGWSMGVWIGSYLLAEYNFDSAIALNGTLCPIHEDFGIAPVIFSRTIEYFNEQHREKFYKRMCDSDGLRCFLRSAPKRQIVDQRQELSFLWRIRQQMALPPEKAAPWHKAVIARRDIIVPTKSQQAFWAGRLPVIEIDGGHYPFARWSCWSECLAL